MTWEDRFWAKVVERPDGCWEWTASRFPSGYGQFGSRSKGIRRGLTTFAHRIAYELVVGVIPKGLQIDHLCRNRSCVNPAHLEPVTCAENIRRGERATASCCSRGHALSGTNLYIVKGRRNCRACREAATQRFHERNPGYRARKAREYRRAAA